MESTRLPGPWDFPGRNTGVGCHFLLPGIFLTQGSNPRLLDWQAVFTTEPPGKPLPSHGPVYFMSLGICLFWTFTLCFHGTPPSSDFSTVCVNLSTVFLHTPVVWLNLDLLSQFLPIQTYLISLLIQLYYSSPE